MLEVPASIPEYFPDDVKKRVALSVRLARILHYMYLAVKNFPQTVRRYRTAGDLIVDTDFAKNVVRREGVYRGFRSIKGYFEPYKAYLELYYSGYCTLLKLLDVVWKLAICSCDDKMRIIEHILGADDRNLVARALLRSKYIRCDHDNLRCLVEGVSLVILELKRGVHAYSLASMSLYLGSLGSLWESNLRLGLGVRMSIKTVDADALSSAQQEGYGLEFGNRFDLYFPLFRIYRTSYRRVNRTDRFQQELVSLISETLYMPKDFEALMAGEAKANVLSALPALSLGDGLGFIASFKGTLLEPLATEARAILDDGHTEIRVLPSYCSMLSWNPHKGDYVFLSVVPLTCPDCAVVLGMWLVDDFPKIKKRHRGVERLSELFPTIGEVLTKRF